MYRFAASVTCLLFLYACSLPHEVETAKDYTNVATNLSNNPATEWISRLNNGAGQRKKSFGVSSKRQLARRVRRLATNLPRPAGTRNNSFSYIPDMFAPYEESSEKENRCKNDDDCKSFLKNSICLEEEVNRMRCSCPFGFYIDSSKDIIQCTKKVPPGTSCQKSEQCTGKSSCHEGKCVCPNGYVSDGYECVRGKGYECTSNYECQQLAKQSVCDITETGSKCRCLPGYVQLSNSECLAKVPLGGVCRTTLQCPKDSICFQYECQCNNGFIKRGNGCEENSPYLKTPNFLLALIAGVICLIVVSCLLVAIMSIRRKIRNAIRQASSESIPTISSQIDAGEPFSPNPVYERYDKPPSYEEAMSSCSSMLTVSIEDISSAPPAYSQVQLQGRNVNSTT